MSAIPTPNELEPITWEEATTVYPGVTSLAGLEKTAVKVYGISLGVDVQGRLTYVISELKNLQFAWYWEPTKLEWVKYAGGQYLWFKEPKSYTTHFQLANALWYTSCQAACYR